MNSPSYSLLGARRKAESVRMFAEQFRVADDGKIDVAPRRQRQTRELQ
jgi:hypothetical protein